MHDDTPRIYVASLTDYNSGLLHGEWIDATQDPDDIFDDIQSMLATSPANRRRGYRVSVPAPRPVAEEWAIHDFDNFGTLTLHEHERIQDVSVAAQLIEEHGEIAAEVIAYVGGLDQLDEAREHLDDRFMGTFEDLEEWAIGQLEDVLAGVPQFLHSYIDYQSYGRDAEMSGDIFSLESGGELHIFSNR